MSDDIIIHTLSQINDAQYKKLLARTEDNLSEFMKRVLPIIDDVEKRGDDALRDYAVRFDGADMDGKDILTTAQDIRNAYDKLDRKLIKALEYAADNIRTFHERQKPEAEWQMEIRPGVLVGERAYPIDRVALYSPRGKGSFPSVTLMTAIPAVVAGVPEPIILTPPGSNGHIDPATLVAADLAGVSQIAKAGGAQAVAAAAFGTPSIPKCRKIEGPGSPWFVAAKRVLADRIWSRLPAGPSEVIIFADGTLDARLAALDILIESEHGPDSSAFLVTTSSELAYSVMSVLPDYMAHMSDERAGYARTVLTGENGGIILADTNEKAYEFINDYAPEHCQVLSATPDPHVAALTTASEILIGPYSVGSLANYMMGPNCVLPTSGAAHAHSPLGVHDFIRTASIGRVEATGFDEMASLTEIFARYEGFDAHANAVSDIRRSILAESGFEKTDSAESKDV